MLELTVSKTGVEVIAAVVSNFGTGVDASKTEGQVNTPPYLFNNDIGTDAVLNVDNTGLVFVANKKIVRGDIQVAAGSQIDLGFDTFVAKTDSPQPKREISVSVSEPSHGALPELILSPSLPDPRLQLQGADSGESRPASVLPPQGRGGTDWESVRVLGRHVHHTRILNPHYSPIDGPGKGPSLNHAFSLSNTSLPFSGRERAGCAGRSLHGVRGQCQHSGSGGSSGNTQPPAPLRV